MRSRTGSWTSVLLLLAPGLGVSAAEPSGIAAPPADQPANTTSPATASTWTFNVRDARMQDIVRASVASESSAPASNTAATSRRESADQPGQPPDATASLNEKLRLIDFRAPSSTLHADRPPLYEL